MTTFFTSDTHFGHARIIEYCNRPFSSVEEMDETIINRWNIVVDHDDTVIHLGDFTLGNLEVAKKYIGQLNGHIKILGYNWHHDARWLKDMKPSSVICSASGHPIEILPPMVVIEYRKSKKHPHVLVLCHYPILVWDRKHYGAWHLYGHTHGTCDLPGYCFDIGVDSNHFYPISISGVERQMRAYGWKEPDDGGA